MQKLMNSEPLRTFFFPLALAALIAAGQAFIEGKDTRGIMLAVVGALVAVLTELSRRLVRPERSAQRAIAAARGRADAGRS